MLPISTAYMRTNLASYDSVDLNDANRGRNSSNSDFISSDIDQQNVGVENAESEYGYESDESNHTDDYDVDSDDESYSACEPIDHEKIALGTILGMTTREMELALVANLDTRDDFISDIGHVLLHTGTGEDVKKAKLIALNFALSQSAATRLEIFSSCSKSIMLTGLDLSGMDFVGLDLRGTDFSNSNLSGANFSRTKLRGAKFINAHLSDVEFRESDLMLCQFLGSDLTRADFTRASLNHADLTKACLQGAKLNALSLASAKFHGADVRNVNFLGVDLRLADFSGANLEGMCFRGVLLINVKFTGANLSNANFKDMDLSYVELDGANLSGADFSNAILFRANFGRANLSRANFTGAQVFKMEFSLGCVIDLNLFDHIDRYDNSFVVRSLKHSPGQPPLQHNHNDSARPTVKSIPRPEVSSLKPVSATAPFNPTTSIKPLQVAMPKKSPESRATPPQKLPLTANSFWSWISGITFGLRSFLRSIQVRLWGSR